jgi:hypothetical protein
MERFDRWVSASHALENGTNFGTRRYFFGAGLFAKVVQLDFARCRAANLRDHRNEVAFLSAPPANFPAPRLLLHGQSDTEAWLAREQLPGTLLVDLIRSGAPYDAGVVLRDVATQLAALEAARLHHSDVRSWNVLIAPDGRATLIDYGAISRDDKDCAWPSNLFLSFLIFAHEVITGEIGDLFPFRSPRLNPDALPEPHRSAFWRLFELPEAEWRFARLRDSLVQMRDGRDRPPSTPRSGLSFALQTMEEACGLYRAATIEWRDRALQAEARVQQLQSRQAAAPASVAA